MLVILLYSWGKMVISTDTNNLEIRKMPYLELRKNNKTLLLLQRNNLYTTQLWCSRVRIEIGSPGLKNSLVLFPVSQFHQPQFHHP